MSMITSDEQFSQALREMAMQVQDPDRLREMIFEVDNLNKIFKNEICSLRKTLDEREKQKQLFLSTEVKQTYHRLKKVAFGFGREKNKIRDRERVQSAKQLTLQSKGLAEENPKFNNVRLPVEIVEHKLSEENILEHCQLSGLEINEGDLVECVQVDKFCEESREITVTERIYTQVVHKRIKYKAINQTTGQNKIITAPGPVKLYPKCQFSVDFAVQKVTDKFLNYLPYERQRQELRRSGANTPVSTFCRLEKGVSVHLEEVAEKIKDDILSTSHLAVGLDETPWPILNKTDSNGYFWTLCNQAGSYYKFEPTRSGDVAQELLKNFKGSVISDKFSGYLQFLNNKNINWGLCLAHARRDFISLQDQYPEECDIVLVLMDKIFKLEHKAKTWDELKVLRKEKSKPLMSKLKSTLMGLRPSFFPKDDMTKAIDYILSNWNEFNNFTEDVKLPVSNNESERALRQVVLGRKNYRGSKTIDAADQAAVLFTVIESCKKAELDPRDYIKYVVESNHRGERPLTPLKLALMERGASEYWPTEESKRVQ